MSHTKPLQADRMRSNFWWRMYFREDAPFTTQAGDKLTEMDGFSKLNGSEAMDWRKSLLSKLEMFWQSKHHYLKNSKYIEVYRRLHLTDTKGECPLFITFYPDRYEIAQRFIATFDPQLRGALNRMYKSIRTGQAPAKGPLIPQKIYSKDQLLEKTGLPSVEAIYEYGSYLKAQGYTTGAWTGWVTREMQRFMARQGKI